MRVRDNGLQACNTPTQFDESSQEPIFMSVKYANDVTILTNTNQDAVKRIIEIYESQTRASTHTKLKFMWGTKNSRIYASKLPKHWDLKIQRTMSLTNLDTNSDPSRRAMQNK